MDFKFDLHVQERRNSCAFLVFFFVQFFRVRAEKKTQHVPKSSTNPTTTKHEKKHKTGKLEYFKQKAQDYSKSSTIPTTKQHKKERKTV